MEELRKMNLSSKKELAKRTFGVGKDRIIFVESRMEDIKEAITKQDLRDLMKEGAIIIKNAGGRRRNAGKRSRDNRKIKKSLNTRKRDYVRATRKLRIYAREMKMSGKISADDLLELRKKIRNKFFRSKVHLKEHLKGDKKTKVQRKGKGHGGKK